MIIICCTGCGSTKPEPNGTPTDFYPAEHCGKCPPWACEECGEMSSAAEPCGCWVMLDTLPFADQKAIFAVNGWSLDQKI